MQYLQIWGGHGGDIAGENGGASRGHTARPQVHNQATRNRDGLRADIQHVRCRLPSESAESGALRAGIQHARACFTSRRVKNFGCGRAVL